MASLLPILSAFLTPGGIQTIGNVSDAILSNVLPDKALGGYINFKNNNRPYFNAVTGSPPTITNSKNNVSNGLPMALPEYRSVVSPIKMSSYRENRAPRKIIQQRPRLTSRRDYNNYSGDEDDDSDDTRRPKRMKPKPKPRMPKKVRDSRGRYV